MRLMPRSKGRSKPSRTPKLSRAQGQCNGTESDTYLTLNWCRLVPGSALGPLFSTDYNPQNKNPINKRWVSLKTDGANV